MINKQEISTVQESAKKQNSPDNRLQQESKNFMIQHQVDDGRVVSIAATSQHQPKFVNPAVVNTNSGRSGSKAPDISDDELLAMAIQFEKEHPEYV